MTKAIKNICVFASSFNDLEEIFYKEAHLLGELIGKSGMNIVYGGSRRGLMYACAGAVKECGGKVIGIMPQKLADMGFLNPDDCNEFYITEGMRERKAKMDELSDAVIALPGGFGTLEEITEIIVQKQLGYNNKPIVFFNINGFYNKLFVFFDEIINQKFAHRIARKLYYIANTAEETIEYLKFYNTDVQEFKHEYLYRR